MLLRFGIIALMFGVLFLVDRWLRKRLHIPHVRGFFYERVNKTQSWIENGLIALFITLDFIFAFYLDGDPSVFLFVGLGAYFITLMAVRLFFEWKYRKKDREYVLTMIWGIFYIPVMWVIWILR